MKILVGLGNPGPEYAQTRHNAGAMALDELAAQLGVTITEKRFQSLSALVNWRGEKLLLLKPQTFMNLSGHAVVAAASFYKVDFNDILVLYDDMDLPLGQLRLRRSGNAGGHKGIASVMEQCGKKEIARLRIGISHSLYDTIDYVLGKFSAEEMTILKPAFQEAAAACLCFCSEGLTKAMNQYNQKAKKKKEHDAV